VGVSINPATVEPIPASGGTLYWDLSAQNQELAALPVDVQFRLEVPNYGPYNLINLPNYSMPAGMNITRRARLPSRPQHRRGCTCWWVRLRVPAAQNSTRWIATPSTKRERMRGRVKNWLAGWGGVLLERNRWGGVVSASNLGLDGPPPTPSIPRPRSTIRSPHTATSACRYTMQPDATRILEAAQL